MPDFILDSKHSPIYVRAHTKKILMETLFADSLFLADHKVMDYSLLCGIDKETNELVIGIIGMLNRSGWVLILNKTWPYFHVSFIYGDDPVYTLLPHC